MRALWILIALGGVAHADVDGDAVRHVIDAQAAAITAADAKAFAATFASDGFSALPGGYGETAAQAGAAMFRTMHPDDGTSATPARIAKAVIGHDGGVAWATIDLGVQVPVGGKLTKRAYRVTELFTRDGAAWKARAIFASQVKRTYEGMTGDLSFPGGVEDAATLPMAPWLVSTAELARHLRAGPDVIVLGSSAGERGAGPAAAKLLQKWKKIPFSLVQGRAGGDGKTFAWLYMIVSNEQDGQPYWALVLAVQGAKGWDVVGAHYAQEQPSPQIAE
jgi:ketosteroid isomerase-like protein